MSTPTTPLSANGRDRRSLVAGLIVCGVAVAIVAGALWTRTVLPGPSQAAVTPQPSTRAAGPTTPVLRPINVDEVIGLADRRFQIRFTLMLGILGAATPYTWRVLATNALEGFAAPLAQGTDRDSRQSFTATLPCGGFNAAFTAALRFDSPMGRAAPAGIIEDAPFTLPASCPQLTAAIQGGEDWQLPVPGKPDRPVWSVGYRVSITNTSGPVTWSGIVYRRGVPDDPGTPLSATTAPDGAAATLVGPGLSCAALLKYSRWRLEATDRLGLAGWWDVGLPFGEHDVAPWLPGSPTMTHPTAS